MKWYQESPSPEQSEPGTGRLAETIQATQETPMPTDDRDEFRGSRNLKAACADFPDQAGGGNRALSRARTRSRGLDQRPHHLALQPRPPARVRGINTFMKAPYCEDVRRVGEYEVAFVRHPLRHRHDLSARTRFGPQAVRRISAVYRLLGRRRGRSCSRSSTCATPATCS